MDKMYFHIKEVHPTQGGRIIAWFESLGACDVAARALGQTALDWSLDRTYEVCPNFNTDIYATYPEA